MFAYLSYLITLLTNINRMMVNVSRMLESKNRHLKQSNTPAQRYNSSHVLCLEPEISSHGDVTSPLRYSIHVGPTNLLTLIVRKRAIT